MDLSNPLATVAPTLDAGVLLVLAATGSMCTAPEVHRRLGYGSDEGVRKVLARLVHQGVVLIDYPTRFPVYSLNRKHLAVRHIVALTILRDEIVAHIRDAVDAWAVAPLHVGLFGSFARGTADDRSDIDVLVVRSDDFSEADEETWAAQISELSRDILAWTGNPAQIVEVSRAALIDMDDASDPLIDSWRADGIPLLGGRFAQFLRSLR